MRLISHLIYAFILNKRRLIKVSKILITLLLPVLFVVGLWEPAWAQSDDKPARIWKVEIEGNNQYQDIVLKKYIANEAPSIWKKLTFFNEKGYYVSETEIRKDEIRLERFYQRRGFPDVDVTHRLETLNKEWKKKLVFIVAEKAPIRIDNVEILLNTTPEDSTRIVNHDEYESAIKKLPFRSRAIYQPVLTQDVQSNISEILRNLGYAYASAEIQAEVDSTAKMANVAVLAYPGPRVRFDTVLVEGETSLPAKYIRRETAISESELFSDDQMRQAQRELFSHHLFRFALISIPDQPQDSTMNVLVRVKERPLRSVQITAGVGNFDRLEDPLGWNNFHKLFRTRASWTYRNVRNKGERFTTSLRFSAYDKRLGADYLFPYVYNTKSSITIAPFAQRRDERAYSILTAGIRNSFGYNYSQEVTGTFSYDYTINQEFDVRKDEFGMPEQSPDSVLNYNISSFKVNVYASYGNPQRGDGFTAQPFVEFSGLFNEASYSFQKASLELRGYKKLTNSTVGAARIQGGAIYFSKQDSLPSDIRFYAGGSSDVRGWNRQELGPKEVVEDSTGRVRIIPIGGRATASFNVELRQEVDRFIKGLSIAGFLDGGQVWRSISSIGSRPIQYGVGGGLRYDSPIGPIRVDIAYKVNPTDRDLGIVPGREAGKWARWGLHLSIGQAF